jgi:sporulation protein YlmC with PRC-barrel domain
MTARQQLLAMAVTAALLALPMLTMAQSSPDTERAAGAPISDRAAGTPISDRAAGASTPTPPGSSIHNQVVDARTLREGRRASRLIGASIYNESAETVGEVDDLLIPRDGGPPVAIISVGGFLGIGAKLVAVPYDNLRKGGSRWTLPGATKESLNVLPGFSYETTASRG